MRTEEAFFAAKARLACGDVLCMEVADGRARFWFENPFSEVEPADALQAISDVGALPGGDAMFGTSSQTWRCPACEGAPT